MQVRRSRFPSFVSRRRSLLLTTMAALTAPYQTETGVVLEIRMAETIT
jgi:hypothetical protein